VPAVVEVRKAAAHMLLKYTCNIYYNFIPATMDIILSKADMTVILKNISYFLLQVV
jgi:hypothetical protein